MTKTLKQIKLGDKNYTYIQNEDGSSNVNGFKFEVTEEIRSYFVNFGGFIRDMFQPLQNEDVIEVVILHIEIPIRGQLTGIYFKNIDGKEFEHHLTDSGKFIEVVKKKLNEGNIQYKEINTLEEIYNNPEYGLNIFLDDYINPKTVNDTGFYIDEKMVNFDETMTTKSVNAAHEIIKHLIKANEENERYNEIELSRIDLKLNEPNPFGIDVKLTFYDINGKQYNSNHEFICKELGRMPSPKEYDEFMEKENLKMLINYAFDLNWKLNNAKRYTSSGKLCRKYRDRRIKEMINSYERDCEEYEMSEYISYSFLKMLIDEDLLRFPE